MQSPRSTIREAITIVRSIDKTLSLVVLSAAALILLRFSLQTTVMSPDVVEKMWSPFFVSHASFYQLCNWFAVQCICFLIIPILLILFFTRQKLSDVGLGIGNVKKYIPVYLILFALFIPIVITASFFQQFADTYPLMRVMVYRYIIAWEVLYLIQFVAIEFFFRGFLLFPFCRQFGAAGILISIIPYCMLHIDKPLPEALGSIAAGLLLSYLAWSSRSIWGGVFLHGAIALSMDITSLLHNLDKIKPI
jgi:uncharacterized protein